MNKTQLEPPMLRLFVVGVYGENHSRATLRVMGNIPQVLPDGTLQILRYFGEIPWTVKLVPHGEWWSLDAELPSADDIKKTEVYNLRRGQREKLMASDTGSTTH